MKKIKIEFAFELLFFKSFARSREFCASSGITFLFFSDTYNLRGSQQRTLTRHNTYATQHFIRNYTPWAPVKTQVEDDREDRAA
jgi:hypothetical protein